jgi:chromosome partitioning protein
MGEAVRKIVAVAHSKGGVGKSNISRNIALSESERGKKVLMVDCDLQKTVETFFSDRAERLEKNEIVCISKTYSKGLAREIKSIAASYDTVVIDVGGARDSDVMRQVLLCADAAIVPTSPSQEDLDSFDLFMTVVDEVRGINEALRVFLFLNKAPSDTFDSSAKAAIAGLKQKYENDIIVCRSIIKHRKAWLKCGYNADAIWEVDGKYSKAAQEFAVLLSELRSQEVL